MIAPTVAILEIPKKTWNFPLNFTPNRLIAVRSQIVISEIEKLLEGADPNKLLNIGEQGWYKKWDSVKGFDSLVDWMKNNMAIDIFDSQMMKRSVGIGLGKVKFAKDDS